MKRKSIVKSIIGLSLMGIIILFFTNMSLAASKGKINVETANLREGADSSSKILELVSQNEEVEVLEKEGTWYKVSVNNITGYIREDLLTVEETPQAQNNTSSEENKEEPQEQQTQETNSPIDTNEEKEITLGTQKIAEDTNLKIVPVINGTDIIEVKKDEEVTVTEILNGWLCVETSVAKGWIRKEKIQQAEEPTTPVSAEEPKTEEPVAEVTETVVNKTLYIKSESVNIRKEANTSSEIVDKATLNTQVNVVAETDEWSKVKVNGKEGYILSSLLSTTRQETSRSSEVRRRATEEAAVQTQKTEEPKAAAPATNTGTGSSVVAKARQYIGSRYIYGGSTPSGFDCSGFTSYIFKQFGVNLSRTAAGQYGNGVSVTKANLQPGDLVMFGKSGINHVGIYAGGGSMVHAANPSRGVTTDTINSGYYATNYVGAKRVL